LIARITSLPSREEKAMQRPSVVELARCAIYETKNPTKKEGKKERKGSDAHGQTASEARAPGRPWLQSWTPGLISHGSAPGLCII